MSRRLLDSNTGRKAEPAKVHEFAAIPDFVETLTKLISIPKATIENREMEWKRARKKKTRAKRH